MDLSERAFITINVSVIRLAQIFEMKPNGELLQRLKYSRPCRCSNFEIRVRRRLGSSPFVVVGYLKRQAKLMGAGRQIIQIRI